MILVTSYVAPLINHSKRRITQMPNGPAENEVRVFGVFNVAELHLLVWTTEAGPSTLNAEAHISSM